MSTNRYVLRILSCLMILSLVFVHGAAAQEEALILKIMRVDDREFADMGVYVSVLDDRGRLVEELTLDNFTLFEDDQAMIPFGITTVVNEEQPLSIVLAVDVSTIAPAGDQDFYDGIVAMKEFVASLKDDDRLAVLSFAEEVVLLQEELSEDKLPVPTLLDELAPEGAHARQEHLRHSQE